MPPQLLRSFEKQNDEAEIANISLSSQIFHFPEACALFGIDPTLRDLLSVTAIAQSAGRKQA